MIAMDSKQLYTDQFGRLSSSRTHEWASPRLVHDPSSNPSLHLRRGGGVDDDSDPSYLDGHHHTVSSFDLAMNYDSSLDTPASLNSASPPVPPASASSQWCRESVSSLQYHAGTNDNNCIYMSTSMPMKSKNRSPTVQMSSVAEIPMPLPFVFDSPPSQCPPSPYWGSYSVSAPQPSTRTKETSSPPRSAAPSQQSNIPAPNLAVAAAAAAAAAAVAAPPPPQAQAPPPSQQQHQQQSHPSGTHPAASQRIQQVQQRYLQVLPQGQNLHPKREGPELSSRIKRVKKSTPEKPVPQLPGNVQLDMADVTDTDKLLLRLKEIKEEEKWDWKEMTSKFNQMTQGDYKVAALQMRHTRLIERMRVWTDTEVRALLHAKRQFDASRWKTIASNMLDYGCQTKWSPRACQLKWAELFPEDPDGLGPLLQHPNNVGANNSDLAECDGSVGARGRQFDDAAARGASRPMATSGKSGARSRQIPYEQQQSWTVRPQR